MVYGHNDLGELPSIRRQSGLEKICVVCIVTCLNLLVATRIWALIYILLKHRKDHINKKAFTSRKVILLYNGSYQV